MERLNKAWLSIWLYVIALISGIILGTLVSHWSVWDWQTRLYAMAAALLPLHVLEEWKFPGGFHTMYNLMAGSDVTKADRYPMNRLSDMWTNFIGVIFSCIVLLVGVNPVFCIMQIFLCLAEIAGHTNGAIYSLKNFRSKGKKTPYNPGFFTMFFGYLPIMIGLIITFFTLQAPTALQWVIGLLGGVALGAFSLKFPEKVTADENSHYAYTWGNGYFEKYLND